MSPSQMPTACLLGSPRRGCNSDTLAGSFIQSATALGAPVETVALSELSYNDCVNLFRCKRDLTTCGQVDDLTPVLERVSQAQVLVLATPVYFTSITGQLKLAIDRFFSFFVPGYPTADIKSRLTPGRHLVFLQTQGEPENRYADLMESYSASFRGLGYDQQHLVRAWSVREPGDILAHPNVLRDCERLAKRIYQSLNPAAHAARRSPVYVLPAVWAPTCAGATKWLLFGRQSSAGRVISARNSPAQPHHPQPKSKPPCPILSMFPSPASTRRPAT